MTELKAKLGPVNWQFATTKRFDADDFAAFLKLLPKSVDGLAIRHVVEVRHESFKHPDFIALAREHGVAVVMAGDCDYPQIADVTAPFVYARIMGTTETEEHGYSAAALDQWASRAKIWAAGGSPQDLATIAPAPKSDGAGREVFLYVISGHKERNPAAAMALIERVTLRRASALDEGQQIRVDRVGVSGRHAVRKALVALEGAVFQELRR